MSIHSEHPFRTPSEPGRRLRSRLGTRVALWCTADAGLTVNSMMIVGGDPWRIMAPLLVESDLADELAGGGRVCVSLLSAGDDYLADAFAGLAPAPGGPFTLADFEQTEYGMRLASADTWAFVDVEPLGEIGWFRLATGAIADAGFGPDVAPLHSLRGQYINPLAGR